MRRAPPIGGIVHAMGKGAAKELWAIAAVAAIAAAPRTIIKMYAAWDQAPQLHWGTWLLVGATWFVPVFVSVCALGAFLRAAILASRRRRRET
jgi:hypothetical protein